MPEAFNMDNFIEMAFTYHAPNDEQIQKYTAIRAAAKQLARLIANSTAQSGEQTLALRKLQESVMWANAAIAFHG